MKIKIIGSEKFKNLITRFHNEMTQIICTKIPQYQKINAEITVIETSQLESAGLSRFTTNELFINTQLTDKEPRFLYEVYGHELAHFFSTLYFQKNIQHGEEWQELMVVLGLPPRECVELSHYQISQTLMIVVECNCYVNSRKEVNRTKFNPNSVCPLCHHGFKII